MLAHDNKSNLNINLLNYVSLKDPDFFISKETQLQTLREIELQNISLYGAVNEKLDDNLVKPINKFNMETFNPFPSDIIEKVKSLIGSENIFEK